VRPDRASRVRQAVGAGAVIAAGWPAVAVAEASWGDLFPVFARVVLLGIAELIAEVCHGLWPLAVVLAGLAWGLKGWMARQGPGADERARAEPESAGLRVARLLLHPTLATVMAILMIFGALLARTLLEPDRLRQSRYSIGAIFRAFEPVPRRLPPESVQPFLREGLRAWPRVATEFASERASAAEFSGAYALTVENGGDGGIYARLCEGKADRCVEVRASYIPGSASIRLTGLAGRTYRVHIRQVVNRNRVARSRTFTLPGDKPFYSLQPRELREGERPFVGDGLFEPGDERIPALIRLPSEIVVLQGWDSLNLQSKAFFGRILPEVF
jgi:hypothetical protein